MKMTDTCSVCGRTIWFNVVNGLRPTLIGVGGLFHHSSTLDGIRCYFRRRRTGERVRPVRWDQQQDVIYRMERLRAERVRRLHKR